jgi:DNA-directed RNA polymerase specialized sigma24 family protein
MAGVARSIVSTYASADEVVQDTWLAVIQGIGAFEARSSLKTWVYRILANTAKRRAMREGRHVSWSLVPGEDDTPTVDPTRFGGPGNAGGRGPHAGGGSAGRVAPTAAGRHHDRNDDTAPDHDACDESPIDTCVPAASTAAA